MMTLIDDSVTLVFVGWFCRILIVVQCFDKYWMAVNIQPGLSLKNEVTRIILVAKA